MPFRLNLRNISFIKLSSNSNHLIVLYRYFNQDTQYFQNPLKQRKQFIKPPKKRKGSETPALDFDIIPVLLIVGDNVYRTFYFSNSR